MTRGRRVALAVLALGFWSSPAHADDQVWPKSYWDGVCRKLGRGVANVFTAPLELIRVPELIGDREGGIAALTIGVAQGVRAAVIREAAGIAEVVMFPIPIPSGFRPLVDPEFIFVNGAWVH